MKTTLNTSCIKEAAVDAAVISFLPALLPVSIQLKSLLNKELKKYLAQQKQETPQCDRYIFTFSDTTYDAEHGGFRPVDITINKSASGEWRLDYMTEFYFIGEELDRSIDFNFLDKIWFSPCSGWQPLPGGFEEKDFYSLWESNFVSYANDGFYDKILIESY